MDKKDLVKVKDLLETDNLSMSDKRKDKIFSDINNNASLKEVLSTFTLVELNNIRRTLEVPGVSKLKKPDLINVLAEKIKLNLASIASKLSEKEYELLLRVLLNGGVLKYEEEKIDIILNLRNYGLLVATKTEDNKRYVLIPQELKPGLSQLIEDKYSETACTVEDTVSSTPNIALSGKGKSKIGRNAPCPCGSGKKYKKCCIPQKLSTVF